MNNETNQIKTCYIYCRVSTEKQDYSNENQNTSCNEYAKANKYQSLRTFIEDGKSGRTTDRPEFQAMLVAIKEHPVDAIIVYKIDRFARNVSDFNTIRKEFKKSGIKLLSVNEGGDVTEGLIGNIFASVAEWESEVNSQRTKVAMAQKFTEGKWPSGAPLGYKNIELSDKKKTIIIDQDKSHLIKMAFEKYATGNYSLYRLVKIMNKKGLRSKKGKLISHSVMGTIISNPFYCGLMKWNGVEKTGIHPILIEKKLYDLCQQVSDKHSNFVTRERKYDFLLRGFIKCNQCGRRYVAEWHPSHNQKDGRIAYYHCNKRERCPSPNVEISLLEGQVEELLTHIRFSKEFINKLTSQVHKYLGNRDKNEAHARKVINNRINSLLQKRDNLEAKLANPVVDMDMFKRVHDDIDADISSAYIELDQLHSHRQFDFKTLEEILEVTRNIPKTYKKAPTFLKKKYLHFFFQSISVDQKLIVKTSYSPLVQELIDQQDIILRQNRLPLVNAFKNREIEFGFSLQNIQTVFDTFNLRQVIEGPQTAYIPA